MKNLIILIAFFTLPTVLNAGWFGPSNYDECILKKMKGQEEAMIHHARKACRKLFPYTSGEYLETIDWESRMTSIIKDDRWPSLTQDAQEGMSQSQAFFDKVFQSQKSWDELTPKVQSEVYSKFYKKVIKIHRQNWPEEKPMADN